NYGLDYSNTGSDFTDFLTMSGPKKIISIGGWGYSTEQYTWPRFSETFSNSKNRAAFISNLVDVTKRYHIDGFDFDWEYPGAPDIPITNGTGLVPHNSSEGEMYLTFIKELRSALP
ncbi:hypothetical protein H4R26_005144, partial [Coemansia thaxteri]